MSSTPTTPSKPQVGEKITSYRCGICPSSRQTFSLHSSLTRHFRHAHPNAVATDANKKAFTIIETTFRCTACPKGKEKQYALHSSLVRHCRHQHKEEESLAHNEESPHKTENLDKAKHDHKFKLPDDDDNDEIIENHVYQVEEGDEAAATSVDRTFSNLTATLITTFRCTICSRYLPAQYTNQGNLRRHVKKSHPDRADDDALSYTEEITKYKCTACSKQYTNQGNLRRHFKAQHEKLYSDYMQRRPEGDQLNDLDTTLNVASSSPDRRSSLRTPTASPISANFESTNKDGMNKGKKRAWDWDADDGYEEDVEVTTKKEKLTESEELWF